MNKINSYTTLGASLSFKLPAIKVSAGIALGLSLVGIAQFAQAAVITSYSDVSSTTTLNDIAGLGGAPSMIQRLADGVTGTIDYVQYWVRKSASSASAIKLYECSSSSSLVMSSTSSILQSGCSVVATSTLGANLTEHPRNPTYPDTPIGWASSTFATKYILSSSKFYAIDFVGVTGTDCNAAADCLWGSAAMYYGWNTFECHTDNTTCTTENRNIYFILNGTSALTSLTSYTDVSSITPILADIASLGGAPSMIQRLADGVTGTIDYVQYWVRKSASSTSDIKLYECTSTSSLVMSSSSILQSGCSVVATSTMGANLTEHPRNPTYPDTPIGWASSTFATKYTLNANKFYAIDFVGVTGTDCNAAADCLWGSAAMYYGWNTSECHTDNTSCTTENRNIYFILNGTSTPITSYTGTTILADIASLGGAPSMIQRLADGTSGQIDNLQYWVRKSASSASDIKLYECSSTSSLVMSSSSILQSGCSVVATSTMGANLTEHPRNPTYPDTPIGWASSTFATKYTMSSSKFYAIDFVGVTGTDCNAAADCLWGSSAMYYGWNTSECHTDNTSCTTENRNIYFILNGSR